MAQNKEVKTAMSGKTSGGNGRYSAKNPVFMLVVALIICLVSALGTSLFKSSGGSVSVKTLNWATPSGHRQSAQLFVPVTATAENPAPAVVVSHGWSDNSEMQDASFIELSRRGYVVLAIDMYGHGNSENVAVNTWWNEENAANGLYDGVKLLVSLPYVDASKIGVAGHSNGAYACNAAVMLDNKADKPLISAVLLVCNDAYYSKTNYYDSFYDGSDVQFVNRYGNRDVGIIAVQHEEVFHRVQYADGTVSSPRDYINQPTAQSFLHFGKNPAGLENRKSYTAYTENIEGRNTIRIIYNPDLFHAWTFFSARGTACIIDFFEKTLPAPKPIASNNQIWQWKALFNAIGLIGFFLFFVFFILAMLRTRVFSSLKADGPVQLREVDQNGRKRMWRGLIWGALFSMFSYPVMFVIGVLARPAFFNQERAWVLGLWSLVCGLFTLLGMRANYRRYAKTSGLDLREQGVVLGKEKMLKTIFLSILAAVCTYSIVFLTTYLFHADFRLWIFFTVRAFNAEKVSSILKILPFLLFFYIVNSISINVFNRIQIGKKEWLNTFVLAVFNALGAGLFLIIMYGYFLAAGLLPFDYLAWGVSSMSFWLISIVAILLLFTVLSRVIYKATKNPYLPGIAYSIVITTMLCTHSWTALV